MTDRFSPEDLELLRDAQEIQIETRAAEGAPLHWTVIWVIVDRQDRVQIRTYQGPGSRWYREIMAMPECRIRVHGHELDVRAMPAGDPDRIAAYNEALLTKYARARSTQAMLAFELQPTTLELVPRA